MLTGAQTEGFGFSIYSSYIDLNGSRFMGIQKLTWNETLEGAEVMHDTEGMPLIETKGTYKATFEIDMLFHEYSAFVTSLGPGYMQRRFNIGAQLQDTGLGLHSLFIPSARILDGGGTLDKSPTIRTIKGSVMGVITLNGLAAVQRGAFANANSIGGSAVVQSTIGASLGL